jgi:tripartite-type tricarboxylate transporter receptor subunit TctC
MICRLILSACLVVVPSLAQVAYAQNPAYPSKPVQIIVPSTAGGSLDLLARIVAVKLGEAWKQPVVVIDKPGASFITGTATAAKAAPDGYTLLVAHNGAMAMNPALFSTLPYDPVKDLAPISRLVYLPMVLFVRNNFPANSVTELLQVVRKDPGKYNHASGGAGSLMVSEMFKSTVGVDYMDIGYKGAAPAVLSTMAGETDLTFADAASGTSALQSGRIRALAVASPQRLRLFPKLPTISESVPGYAEVNWVGMFAPTGTPPEIIAKINGDVRRALAMPDVESQFVAIGLEPSPTSPEELSTIIRTDIDKWKRLVKERHISVSE